jgi:cytochrome c oxidase subunit 2
MSERAHLRRLVLIWLVLSAIATPLVVVLFAPIVPPGNGTVQSAGQVVDNTVLFGISTPISLAVLVFFLYCVFAFRERDLSSTLEGPPVRGHAGIQTTWVAVTGVIVLSLAVYGSVRLLSDGSGGGQGPSPIAIPAAAKGDPPLQVQVIAQQWEFTYRFPGYGGVETQRLEIPANTLVELHVTSLDVIHSFWAVQLGVKADANPGVDNVAYVQTKGPLQFNVRCVELCGVWHGYMFKNNNRVVSKADFASWIAGQQQQFSAIKGSLTPYAKNYFPAPGRRGG